jgi:hypothetical protein
MMFLAAALVQRETLATAPLPQRFDGSRAQP